MFSNTLIDAIKNSKNLVVLTGAGVSSESGIPTFRENNGIWKNFDIEKLASEKGFLSDPAYAWHFYKQCKFEILKKSPNPAHIALVNLAKKLPKLTLITQNVDDLHERAGSDNVLYLHGNIFKSQCISCRRIYSNSLEKFIDSSIEDLEPSADSIPKCQSCDGILRPNVVWFGEELPKNTLSQATHAANECDLMLIIGTSGLVYPAATIPMIANNKGIKIIQIDPNETGFDSVATFNFKGKAGEVLPELYKAAFGG